MTENERKIAMRIKELREASGETAEEVAAALGMSPQKYCDYENGVTDISISFLCEIAARYNVEVTTLLTGEDPKLKVYSLLRKGNGPTVERRKEYRYESLAESFTNKKCQPFLVTVDPNVEETPISLNSHPGQELDYVLSGQLCISINGKEMVLTEGDCLYFDSSYAHGMKAIGNEPAKFIAIVLG